nr:hypothetical protein [Youngiibacter fragilis]
MTGDAVKPGFPASDGGFFHSDFGVIQNSFDAFCWMPFVGNHRAGQLVMDSATA